MGSIESTANPLVKRLVRLREQRRERDAEGVAFVEGAREVARAAAGGWPLRLLVICPALSPADFTPPAAAEVVTFGAAAFERVSGREHPDGVLALATPPERTLADVAWRAGGLYLVIDGLEKPGNVGALLRSADAVGVDAVFVTGAGTDVANPNVVRASMGSLFARPVLAVDAGALRAALQAAGVQVVATSPRGEQVFWDTDLRGAIAIVVGGEHDGLAADWLHAADLAVRVPMADGLADSLNVATTGALLLFEALRQRRG
jgi:RNA methyltransferase, TrmH family